MVWGQIAWSSWALPAPLVAGKTVEGAHLASVRLARYFMALLWLLFARSALAHSATVVAGTTDEGADLASERSVGVRSAIHCCRGHDIYWRCSGLCSLGRRWLIQPLWWWARQVSALLWPLFSV